MNGSGLWPLGVYASAAILLAASMIGLSWVLGERHRGRATDEPYESGMVPTGSARLRFDVRFYLTAMFFVIFDIEAVFLFAWAIVVREAGWAGFAEALVFSLVLLAALGWLWRIGALDWGRLPRASAPGRPGHFHPIAGALAEAGRQ